MKPITPRKDYMYAPSTVATLVVGILAIFAFVLYINGGPPTAN